MLNFNGLIFQLFLGRLPMTHFVTKVNCCVNLLNMFITCSTCYAGFILESGHTHTHAHAHILILWTEQFQGTRHMVAFGQHTPG